jgi:hypothetical protein
MRNFIKFTILLFIFFGIINQVFASTWTNVGSPSFTPYATGGNSIAMDSNGNIYILPLVII